MFVVCCENLWKQLSITWVQFIWYSSPFKRQNISPLQLFLEYSAGIQLKQRAHNSFVFESRSLPMPSISSNPEKNISCNMSWKELWYHSNPEKCFLCNYMWKEPSQFWIADQTVPVRRAFLCSLNWHFYH